MGARSRLIMHRGVPFSLKHRVAFVANIVRRRNGKVLLLDNNGMAGR